MIYLKSNNDLIFKVFYNLLDQKNILQKNKNYENIPILKVEDSNDKIKVIFKEFNKIYFKPINVNSLLSDLIKEISKINYNFGEKLYFPFLREISNNQTKVYLSDIQNHILSCLIHYPKGVNKEDLYRSIWSHDKNISINKLDTHLTNLKNLLIEELNLEINFKSFEKNLRLVVD